MQPLIHLSQLSILRSGLGISDIDTQLNYIYKKWIQRLLTPILTIFEISHAVLIEINSEFGSRPSPFFYTKTDPHRSTKHKNLQKHNNKDFFIQLLYAWLYL